MFVCYILSATQFCKSVPNFMPQKITFAHCRHCRPLGIGYIHIYTFIRLHANFIAFTCSWDFMRLKPKTNTKWLRLSVKCTKKDLKSHCETKWNALSSAYKSLSNKYTYIYKYIHWKVLYIDFSVWFHWFFVYIWC